MPTNALDKIIYAKLLQLIPDLPEHLDNGCAYGVSQITSSGTLNVYFDYVRREGTAHVISLSQYEIVDGDAAPSPGIEIRVDPALGTAGALSFLNQHICQATYHEIGGMNYPTEHYKELNQYLDVWLAANIKIGHRIDLSPERSADIELPEHDHDIEQSLTR